MGSKKVIMVAPSEAESDRSHNKEDTQRNLIMINTVLKGERKKRETRYDKTSADRGKQEAAATPSIEEENATHSK